MSQAIRNSLYVVLAVLLTWARGASNSRTILCRLVVCSCFTSPRCSVSFSHRFTSEWGRNSCSAWISLLIYHKQHRHTHKYMQLEYGWTIFSSSLTGSRWWCQGQLLLPHLCSAVRVQSSLWTAYYPDTAPGESNKHQRCTTHAPDGVGDGSSHYIRAC